MANPAVTFASKPYIKAVLSKKPSDEGFSLIELVVVIAVLAILSAVAIPAFQGVQANGKASAAKNALVNAVKECTVREADDKSTLWADAQSNNANLNGYTLSALQGNTSCFAGFATADDTTNYANFSISYNPTTGATTKTCTKAAPGCSAANASW
jgi:prepilin-type N-terminal cleavage/methylation domain-containing protein